MHSPTFARLLAYVSVLTLFASASAKPFPKNRLDILQARHHTDGGDEYTSNPSAVPAKTVPVAAEDSPSFLSSVLTSTDNTNDNTVLAFPLIDDKILASPQNRINTALQPSLNAGDSSSTCGSPAVGDVVLPGFTSPRLNAATTGGTNGIPVTPVFAALDSNRLSTNAAGIAGSVSGIVSGLESGDVNSIVTPLDTVLSNNGGARLVPSVESAPTDLGLGLANVDSNILGAGPGITSPSTNGGPVNVDLNLGDLTDVASPSTPSVATVQVVPSGGDTTLLSVGDLEGGGISGVKSTLEVPDNNGLGCGSDSDISAEIANICAAVDLSDGSSTTPGASAAGVSLASPNNVESALNAEQGTPNGSPATGTLSLDLDSTSGDGGATFAILGEHKVVSPNSVGSVAVTANKQTNGLLGLNIGL